MTLECDRTLVGRGQWVIRLTGSRQVRAAVGFEQRLVGRGGARRVDYPTVAAAYVGASVRRREDPRLLTGAGQFVDDLVRPGALHAAVRRSPLAHAGIVAIDVAPAQR